MDVDIQSVEVLSSTSDDSDIEVIACYRQVPIQPEGLVAGPKMSVDISDCANDNHPDFPWEDFDSMLHLVVSQADRLIHWIWEQGLVQRPRVVACLLSTAVS